VVLFVPFLIASSCGGDSVGAPDASASSAVSDRIALVGQGQDWYKAINLVNGRPDAVKMGPLIDYAPAEVRLAPGIEPEDPLVSRACEAIGTALNSARFGPPLNVTTIDVFNGTNTKVITCYGAEPSDSPS
jgi:hypothetical protein